MNSILKSIGLVTVGIVLGFLLSQFGCKKNCPEFEETEVTVSDTTYLVKLDTVYIQSEPIVLPGRTKYVRIKEKAVQPVGDTATVHLYASNHVDSLVNIQDSIYIRNNKVIQHDRNYTVDTLKVIDTVLITRDSIITIDKETVKTRAVKEFKKGLFLGGSISIDPITQNNLDGTGLMQGFEPEFGYQWSNGFSVKFVKSLNCLECFEVGATIMLGKR